ncbi:MAG: hypothetical protein JNL08_09200 [Planctomycetes bacterium]|nr:hypothetical protein [Planctomycetota bacterium]
MRTLLLHALLFVGCGAVAGWLVGGLLPPAARADELQPWTTSYRDERPDGQPFEVKDGKWLRVLRLFPDFDLHMDLELGPDMDLDVLVRHVQPRLVQGEVTPFTDRFVVLRLTTGRLGPAWRTREQALFGERRSGASLAPGLPATVWIQGRGRLVRANVAGRWTDWITAEDTEGMLALVAHGGTAALQRLVVESRGATGAWLRWRATWPWLGALAGAVVAAVLAVGRRLPGPAACLLAACVPVSVAWAVARAPLEPLRQPPPVGLLLLLAAPHAAVLGVLAAASLRRSAARAAALLLAGAAWFGAEALADRALRSDTAQVDACFGPRAGSAASEALAGIVRGPFGLRSAADANSGVFLLGGRLLYGRLAPAVEHLEALLGGELRARLGRAVPVVGLPTEEDHAHAQQQWTLFTRFYSAFAPRVVVFGVPATEGDLDALGVRRTFPSTLEALLRQVHASVSERGAALVLFTEPGLAEDLLAVVRAAAAAGVPLVTAGADEPNGALARRLADAIAPLLRP